MTSREIARSHLRLAQTILDEAARLQGQRASGLVVRRCQESVELALKGLLRLSGAEVPHVHDVGGALRRNASRLPKEARAQTDFLATASQKLREDREVAFYGDESTGMEPEALFSESDAEEALRTARRVVEICLRAEADRGA